MLRKIKYIGIISFILLIVFINNETNAQILSAPNASLSVPTNYVKTQTNDSVFIFCVPQQLADSIDIELKAEALFANVPYNYTWYKYDPENFKFNVVKTEMESYSEFSYKVIAKSGLYAVKIEKTGTTNYTAYQQAWVFINDPEIIIDKPDSLEISNLTLKGYFNPNFNDESEPYNFKYFEPDTAQFLISESTQIKVCFSVDHDTVSQLGFYLSPPNGDTIVELLPAISEWSQITEIDSGILNCNDFNEDCLSGSNFVDFCFSTEATQVPCVCDLGSFISGEYAIVGDWSAVYGRNPAEKDWKVSFFDCNDNNSKTLKKVILTFTDSVNGEQITYTHKLDEGDITIETSAFCNNLNDVYSYTIPVSREDTLTLQNPYSYVWRSIPYMVIPDSSTSLEPLIKPYPVFNTKFILTVTDTFGCVFADTILFFPTVSEIAFNNVFAPERADGNLKFEKAELIRQVNLKIFNRFGQMVYETNDPGFSWDGKNMNNNRDLPAGVYFYLLQAVGWDNKIYQINQSTTTSNDQQTPDNTTLNNTKQKKPKIIQRGTIYLYRSR